MQGFDARKHYPKVLLLKYPVRIPELTYEVMGGFTQRPWTPTKRRAPIAAELSSPGPAYQLPQLLGELRIEN